MLEKNYSHPEIERKWVAAWKKAALFRSERSQEGKRSYTIVIPPPNVTGALHCGHALNNMLQDVLVRFHRMHGREACWVPGCDHGGIATQNVMEKQLKGEGRTRQELGRDKFLERMRKWTHECKSTILGQLERLGCSLDFSREAFTMDEARARAVLHAFKHFYEKGLIYRGERIVNWCVRCGTALSDIEVEHEERKSHLWHIQYPFADDPAKHVTVATTRPETMLGDTAVAVHPTDKRYKGLVGKRLKLPLTDRTLPIVADEEVDPSFGTGAVKVTPRHDPADFDIWQRHLREMEEPPLAIGLDGRMTDQVPQKYIGKSREQCRKVVVEDLEEQGVLAGIEDYRHAVGVCYRCEQAVEPLTSEQWFMKMGGLADKAAAAAEDGRFTLWPSSWKKPYVKWLREIRDWCLSRQIWWGHRLPVWYCVDCLGDGLHCAVGNDYGTIRDLLDDRHIAFEKIAEEGTYRFHSEGRKLEKGVAVQAEKPGKCPTCGGSRWLQDQDVLDTWFSSALWPLSVFGWPGETADLAFYYPTSVLVTGYEILYLWVARMQMMGLHFKDEVPFTDCYIHGIVRDKRGKKMSKSLGNVVDPLILMDKYGTDAFRFSLAIQAYPGKDIPYAEESVTGARNFSNKIWNSTRFVLMNLPEKAPKGGYRLDALDREKLELADRWVLSEYQRAVERCREAMKDYNLAAAGDELYGFLWDKFCDWYVELAKPRLEDPAPLAQASGTETLKAPASKETVLTLLVQVLSGTLKMLHPFMPYITEELHAALAPYAGEQAGFLLRTEAPRPKELRDEDAEKRMGAVMDAVKALRALRSQLNVPPKLEIRVFHSGDAAGVLAHADYVKRLARAGEIAAAPNGRQPPHSATAVSGKLTFYVPLEGLIDFEKEKQRLSKELDRLSKELKRCSSQLSNKNFLERAPKSEVEKIRGRRHEAEVKHSSLELTLKSLSS